MVALNVNQEVPFHLSAHPATCAPSPHPFVCLHCNPSLHPRNRNSLAVHIEHTVVALDVKQIAYLNLSADPNTYASSPLYAPLSTPYEPFGSPTNAPASRHSLAVHVEHTVVALDVEQEGKQDVFHKVHGKEHEDEVAPGHVQHGVEGVMDEVPEAGDAKAGDAGDVGLRAVDQAGYLRTGNLRVGGVNGLVSRQDVASRGELQTVGLRAVK